MAETKQTTARANANRDRRSELIRFVKGRTLLLAIFMLPLIVVPALWLIVSIVAGTSVHEIVAVILTAGLGLAFMFLLFVLGEVVLPCLQTWFGWDEWVQRSLRKGLKKRLSALSDAQKTPFQAEQRCRVSPTEEVWVRHVRNPQPQGHELFLEVLYSKNSGQTWQKLPLRLSPWARFKCIMLDGEWPPTSASRNLSCDNNGISFEVAGKDVWENWPNVWRATYRPRRKWWTMKMVGPFWVEAGSERLLSGENQQ